MASLFDEIGAKYGLDPNILARFVQIESGGNPSVVNKYGYSGLLQLSPGEFSKYGSGNILDPRANLEAGAAKLRSESDAFLKRYGRNPTAGDLYLQHQQGVGGAGAHMANPGAPAWENMASTLEGRQKGPEWAKRAIWGNIPDDPRTSPSFNKTMFPNGVESVTSADFMKGWKSKVEGNGMPTAAQLMAEKLRQRYGSPVAQAPIAQAAPTQIQAVQQEAPDAATAQSADPSWINKLIAAFSGGGAGTPAQRLADAQSLIQAGRAAPIASPYQLAGSLAQQGVGTFMKQRALADQQKQTEELKRALLGAGDSAALAKTLIASGDPESMKMGITLLSKTMTPKQAEKFGTTPQYFRDKDGKLKIAQLSQSGGMRIVDAPEGADILPPTSTMNLGTSIGVLDKTGRVIATVPKNVAGEQIERAVGKSQGEIRQILPAMKSSVDNALRTIEKTKAHPGIDVGTGKSYWLDPRSWIPGTEGYDFIAKLKESKSQEFMVARENLKGAGPVTDFEGRTGQEAIANLDAAQSKPQFLDALNNVSRMLKEAYAAKVKAAGLTLDQVPAVSGAYDNGAGTGTSEDTKPTVSRQRPTNMSDAQLVEEAKKAVASGKDEAAIRKQLSDWGVQF